MVSKPFPVDPDMNILDVFSGHFGAPFEDVVSSPVDG